MPTAAYLAGALAPETGEVYLVLLEIDHAELDAPLRFVANDEAVTSNGEIFEPFPFSFVEPDEDEDNFRPAKLSIDNVDQRIAQTVRELSSAPSVVVTVVLASDPDQVQRAYPTFSLTDVEWTALTVTGSLTTPDDTGEPASSWVFTPGFAPGLF